MQIGYARVSTQDQDMRLQYKALRQVPCDKIYDDKASGAKASREGLKLVPPHSCTTNRLGKLILKTLLHCLSKLHSTFHLTNK